HLWKIHTFDQIMKNFVTSFNIQPTSEGKTQILSLMTNCFGFKRISAIFGPNTVSRYQIWNANTHFRTNGPGFPIQKPFRMRNGISGQKILNTIKFIQQNSSTGFAHQTSSVRSANSQTFSRLTKGNPDKRIIQRLNGPKLLLYKRMLSRPIGTTVGRSTF